MKIRVGEKYVRYMNKFIDLKDMDPITSALLSDIYDGLKYKESVIEISINNGIVFDIKKLKYNYIFLPS